MEKKLKITGRRLISRIRFNLYLFVVVFLFVQSCISPYIADYEGVKDLLVVDGSLIKGAEKQVIRISRSSSVLIPEFENPEYKPVEGCQVKVVDDAENEFIFSEKSEGEYIAEIDDALLDYGSQYKLVFSTPSGEVYESGFQELLETAPVDSVYCIEEFHYDPNLNANSSQGYQFYVDLDAPDDASKYYRWLIEETWEVRALYKLIGIYDGHTVKLDGNKADLVDSIYYCWKNRLADGIYTKSTEKLSQNVVKEIPLHFRLIDANQLGIKYCATIKQFALDRDAYDYWYQREQNITESDQIYVNQPGQSESNIYNINNPGEKVIGFFWASSLSFKCLFLENGRGGEDPDPLFCKPIRVADNLNWEDMEGRILNIIRTYARTNYVPIPTYIGYECGTGGCTYLVAVNSECADCRVLLGKTQKPDFWGPHPSDSP